MYHHVKQLMFPVRVAEPDPRFGNMLLEQFGGANGELAAAMQYSIPRTENSPPRCNTRYKVSIAKTPTVRIS